MSFMEGNDFAKPIFFLKYKEDHMRTPLSIYRFQRKFNHNFRLISFRNEQAYINQPNFAAIINRLAKIEEEKMRHRLLFWTIGLVAVILASACAPAAPLTAPAAVDTPPAPLATPTQTPETASLPQSATEAPVLIGQTPQAVATSRGPNLEATDPTTVALASGGLQLVEFFRFT